MLGKVGLGELGIISSTAGMFGVFAGFGLGMTSTKYVAEHRFKDPAKAGRIMALTGLTAAVTGGTMALALAILAPWLARHTLAAPHLTGLLKISALSLFLGALNGAQVGALGGFEAFRTGAILALVGGIASFPLVVGGVYLAGLSGAVWAGVASSGLSWLLCHLALRREAARAGVPFTFSGCLQELPVLWRFSFPAFLSGTMVAPVTWACNAILVNQPNGYAEMGLFNVAGQWRSLVLFLPMTMGRVVLPLMCDAHGRGDVQRYAKVVGANLRAIWAIALPITVLGIGASPLLAQIYGREFIEARYVIAVLLLATFLNVVNGTVGQALVSSGKMWVGTIMNLAWAMVLLASAQILVTQNGSLGLSVAYLIAYTAHTVWVMWYVQARLAPGILERTKWLALASIILIACAFLTRLSSSRACSAAFVGILVGLAIYAGMLAVPRFGFRQLASAILSNNPRARCQ